MIISTLTTGSSPQTLQQNSTRAPSGQTIDQTHHEKITTNTPRQSVQPEDDYDDEGIYTLPGQIIAACQNSRTDSVTYYNCLPLSVSQPLPQGMGSESSSLLVTGANNAGRRPVPAPKPKREKTLTGIRNVYPMLN